MSTELKSRDQMDTKYSWNLSDMIASDKEWQLLYDDVLDLTDKLAALEGTLLLSPDHLYNYLILDEELNIKLMRLFVYSNMNSHQDTGNSSVQEMVQKVGSLVVQVTSKLSFIEPEIMSGDSAVLLNYINEKKELKVYTHYFLNKLRQKEHVLPKEQEELLALAGDFTSTPQSIFSMFMNADLILPEVIDEAHNTVRLTNGNFIKWLKSPDVNVRRTAFEGMYNTLASNKNTLASIHLASLKKDVFLMRSRKYSSTRKSSLDPKNIDEAVYDNLIDTIHENLPLLHRYVALRKKMLKLDELHMYDLYTPIVADMDDKIPFEEAKTIVTKALKPLGDDYIDTLTHGLNDGWIDVYENKGKRSGAYSWGSYGTHPYVLLNYQDTLNNTFTLAHEMGHALHSYYSNETQPYVYHKYPIFLAEVASTVNESLLINYLLSTTKAIEKRKYLLNHFMESFRTTVYRQVMFAEFEKITHAKLEKGDALTSDILCEIYLDLNKKYYGDNIVVDELIKYEWARIPHFYTSFYVYQYATGFSAAVTLSQKILNGTKEDITNYRNFLKSGSSKYPLDTLKAAGVDMTTTEPIKKALSVFETLLDEMEKYV